MKLDCTWNAAPLRTSKRYFQDMEFSSVQRWFTTETLRHGEEEEKQVSGSELQVSAKGRINGGSHLLSPRLKRVPGILRTFVSLRWNLFSTLSHPRLTSMSPRRT